MLDKCYEQSFEQLICAVENKLQLTSSLLTLLQSDRGVTRPTPFELRTSSRFRCYGECVVEIASGSFNMPGQDTKSFAIVRDLSRKGIGIIAHQQWFPDQLMNLQLKNAHIVAQVARARRLNPFCYEIGLMIVKHQVISE